MSKKQKKKSKWFIFFIVLVLAGVAAGAIWFVIHQQSDKQSRETIEQIKENPPENIADQAHTLIAEYHEKYNKLTGYGSINGLNENEAKSISALLEKDMEQVINQGVDNPKLAEDFDHILELAKATKNNADKEQVRLLHRYFHDLDIAVNQYDQTNDVFGVTKTLGK